MVGKRVRRPVEAARAAILQAAERRLAADGPEGVKIQRVARDVGVREATVHYHFGDRRGLLEALVRYSGRRFAADVEAACAATDAAPMDLSQVASMFARLYAERGAAQLVLHLLAAGWSPEGEGLFRPLAERLHAERVRQAQLSGQPIPEWADAQRMVAAVGALAFAQTVAGDAHLRGVGLPPDEPDLSAWLVARLAPPPPGSQA